MRESGVGAILHRFPVQNSSSTADLLYFLDYQLDEFLPWHSTVSRTRQLISVELFEEARTNLVCGGRHGRRPYQVIYSALIKANASMGSLELKVSQEQLEAYIQQVRTFSQADRRARHDKALPEQRTNEKELEVLESGATATCVKGKGKKIALTSQSKNGKNEFNFYFL